MKVCFRCGKEHNGSDVICETCIKELLKKNKHKKKRVKPQLQPLADGLFALASLFFI